VPGCNGPALLQRAASQRPQTSHASGFEPGRGDEGEVGGWLALPVRCSDTAEPRPGGHQGETPPARPGMGMFPCGSGPGSRSSFSPSFVVLGRGGWVFLFRFVFFCDLGTPWLITEPWYSAFRFTSLQGAGLSRAPHSCQVARGQPAGYVFHS
jgi:hypothetical protein